MLEKLGFTSKFNLSFDKLKSFDSNLIYNLHQIKYANLYKSISDGEKNIDIYAIQTVNGERGLLLNNSTLNIEVISVRFINEMLIQSKS